MNKVLLLILGAVLFVVVLLPPLIGGIYLLSVLITIFWSLVINSSWDTLGGFTGYSDFGHGAYFGLGAYATAVLTKYFGLYLFAIPIGCLLAAALSVVIGWPCLRLKGIYFSLATIPFGFIFSSLIILLPFTNGALGLTITSPYRLSLSLDETIFYELFLAAALATLLVSYKILHSKIGAGAMAIREDEDAARALGVSATRVKLILYALSGFLAALAGGLYCCYTLYIDPPTVFAFSLSLYAIGASYLGGRGTVLGPLIGTVIIVTLANQLRYMIPTTFAGLDLVLMGAILVGIVLFVPEGIVGYIKRKYKVGF